MNVWYDWLIKKCTVYSYQCDSTVTMLVCNANIIIASFSKSKILCSLAIYYIFSYVMYTLTYDNWPH